MVIYKIQIPLQPQSVNHIYGHRAFKNRVIKYVTSKGKTFKEVAKSCINKDVVKLEGNLFAFIKLFFKDKRKRDVDNYSKGIFDTFNNILYEDDSQIKLLTVIKSIDSEFPRTEFIVGHFDELHNAPNIFDGVD